MRTGESYVEIMGSKRGVIVDGDGQFFAQVAHKWQSQCCPIQSVV